MSEEKSAFLENLKKDFFKSHWPKCNEIADKITLIGGNTARDILIEALKAKRHHIRSAAITGLVKLNDPEALTFIKPLINDPSYETREDAKNAVKHFEKCEEEA